MTQTHAFADDRSLDLVGYQVLFGLQLVANRTLFILIIKELRNHTNGDSLSLSEVVSIKQNKLIY